MNLKELDSFKLSDAIKLHNALNPKLWMHNKLRPEVKKQLKKIAEDFIEELGISGLDVKDLTISGSNAAYTYTPHSDLDLHVLIDMNELPNNEVYRELFNAKKTVYNDSHDIKIHGVPVELYVQDINQPVVSLGEYSLLRDTWIKMPSKRRASFDQNATKAKYEKLHAIVTHALKSKDLTVIKNVIKKVKQYRQAGLDKAGEFSPENLAYKVLRNQDYITKLYDLRDKLHSEELTIETMYSQPESTKLLDRPTLTVRALAAKHNVTVKQLLDQLTKGIKVELEHTTYGQTAREIALDHLADDPNYYTKQKKAKLEEEKYDELPEKVYHVTPADNLDEILRHGLVPQIGLRTRKIEGEKPAVYCFPDKATMEDAVMNWLGDEFDEDESLALLEIDTDGLRGQVTDGAQYEVAITDSIPVEKIRILSKDLATPINEDQSMQFAAEKTPPVNPYGGFRDTQYRGSISEQELYEELSTGKYAIHLSNLPKYHNGKRDSLIDFVPERETHLFALHPDPKYLKNTLMGLTGKDWREFAYNSRMMAGYRPSLVKITPDTLVADMFLADRYYSNIGNPTPEDKKKAGLAYAASVMPLSQADLSQYKKPELLIPKAALEFIKASPREITTAIKDWGENSVNESSGYIPSEKEKNDPRFKTALTVDVRPDAIQKNAKAFGFKVKRNGVPPLLRS